LHEYFSSFFYTSRGTSENDELFLMEKHQPEQRNPLVHSGKLSMEKEYIGKRF